jgi:hypothetical protein
MRFQSEVLLSTAIYANWNGVLSESSISSAHFGNVPSPPHIHGHAESSLAINAPSWIKAPASLK